MPGGGSQNLSATQVVAEEWWKRPGFRSAGRPTFEVLVSLEVKHVVAF